MELGLNGPVERQGLPWGPRLDQAQRMAVTRLSGTAERLAYGNLKETPDDQAFGLLLTITRDPLVWGVVLGGVLADIELRRGALKAPIVEWARRAGADEDAAETHMRWRLAQPLNMGPTTD